MCGIVYAHDFTGNPVNNGILQQFDKQRARGTEGFGLFDGLHLVRAAREDKILKWLVKYDSDLLLFHHRNPTSTINVKRAAHPFSTREYFGDNQYIMVHNGVITNPDEMYEKHQKMGIKYQSQLVDGTFNDSEALAWELALTLEGKQEKLEARGGIAFVCMKLVKGEKSKLYFGRNSSPLNMYRDKQGIALSSEGPGESIDDQKLYTFNYDLNRLTKRAFDIPRYIVSTYKSNDAWEDDDDWYGNRTRWPQPKTAPQLPYALGNAVDSYLERQYGNTYMDFDSDGNPIEDYDDEYYVGTDLSEDEMREVELYVEGSREIENRVFDYLCANKGIFEQAYYNAEEDYQIALEQEETRSNYQEVLVLEGVLDKLATDKEFKNEKSISSVWRAVWQG